MKIPYQLFQFNGESALLLVTGRQDAVLYHAENGAIEKIDSFKIPRPHYSDNEGSKARSSSMAIRSGTTREVKNEDIERDFIHELQSRVRKIRMRRFSHVYVYTPPQTRKKIQEALPIDLRPRVKKIIEGNYYHHAPLELVKKITHSSDQRVRTPIHSEAARIMRKSEIARRVIKRK